MVIVSLYFAHQFRSCRRRHHTYLFSLARACAIGLMLSACSISNGKPYFNITGGADATRPTVNDLVDHIACELAASMYRHLHDPSDRHSVVTPSGTPEDVLWDRLLEDNFVANVSLGLQVTNNEGLNPSLTFPMPYNPIPIPGLPGGMLQSFSGNFTLGVNGQLDGSQYRTFTFSYLIDLARLYNLLSETAYYEDNNGHPVMEIPHPSLNTELNSKEYSKLSPEEQREYIRFVSREPRNRKFNCDVGSTLQGNLGLDEVLSTGLSSLDRTKLYNVFGAPNSVQANPATAENALPPFAEHIIPNQPNFLLAPEYKRGATINTVNQTLIGIQNQLSQITQLLRNISTSMAATPPASVPTATLAAITGPSQTVFFSSTLQFMVTEGVSGGPNWTLRRFTGPNGGSSVAQLEHHGQKIDYLSISCKMHAAP